MVVAIWEVDASGNLVVLDTDVRGPGNLLGSF